MNALKVIFLTVIFTLSSCTKETERVIQQNDRLNSLYGSHSDYRSFFEKLKRNIKEGRKEVVADMVDYPVMINMKGQRIKINNKDEFVHSYDVIINKKTEKEVENQKYEDLFARDTGIMTGKSGEIWFGRICKDRECKKSEIKVIAINN